MNKLFSLENQGLFELYPMRMPMRAAVFCRRTVCFLMKHPIKLGEAGKAAGHSNTGYGFFCAGKEELGVNNSYILNVLSETKTSNLFKLPGQITRADEKRSCQAFQRQRLGIVGMDIRAYFRNFVCNGRIVSLVEI